MNIHDQHIVTSQCHILTPAVVFPRLPHPTLCNIPVLPPSPLPVSHSDHGALSLLDLPGATGVHGRHTDQCEQVRDDGRLDLAVERRVTAQGGRQVHLQQPRAQRRVDQDVEPVQLCAARVTPVVSSGRRTGARDDDDDDLGLRAPGLPWSSAPITG